MVDVTVHSVPTENVIFDTFDGSFVRLSMASGELIEALRDAIRPIYSPGYGDATGLEWLKDGDLIIGYESEGGTYAYPIKVLNSRELVNDVIDNRPILVSYCPLCGSGVVYSRELDERHFSSATPAPSTSRTWSCTTTVQVPTGSRSWARP